MNCLNVGTILFIEFQKYKNWETAWIADLFTDGE